MGEPGSRVSRDRTSELQNDANRGAERSFGQDAKTGGRDAHPARNRGIPDSLSAVVRKAMAFERDARYASVAELQADLAAYQGGFATRAEDAGAWRQFNLFLRRHRVLASSVAVSLLLIAFLSAVFTVRVIQERDRAERGEKTAREQRDTALRSQQETSAVLEFFQNEVLAAPRPEGQDRGKGRNITLMDAINAAEPKIGRGFSNQPLVEASIRGAMGMTYFYLGDLERASANHLKAAELRSSILGPEHPDTLKSRNHLANVYQNSGRNEQAISLYEDILNIRKENFGEEHPGSLESIHNLAIAYRAAGRLGEAIQLLEKMLPIQQAKLGTDHPGTQVAMSSLANAYHSMGRLAEAIALGEETVLLMKARLGADHPDTLTSMSDLAAAYEQTGRNADAIAIHEQTLSVRKDKLGTDHPDTLTSMNNLAFAYASAGRIEEAIALHQQTLVLRKSRLGEDHPHTLISMNNLALAYASAGRHEEAMALHEKALASRRATLGSDHPDTLTSMNNLALALTRADRLGEAIALHEQMLPLQKAKLGMDHRNTLSSMHNLASAYRYADRLDDAVALHAQALPLQKARLGPEHLDTIGTMVGLGQCLVLQGKTAEAEPMLRAAVQTLSDKNLTGWRVLDARCFLGRALSGQKKHAEAEPLLLDGYAGLKEQIARIPAGQRVRCLRSALTGLVQLYAQWDKPEEAARWRQELDEFNSRERTTPN